MKNKTYGLIGGLVVILGTIAIYLLSVRTIYKLPMCWICLSAILLSEISTVLSYLLMDKGLKRIGISVALAMQTLVTLILSVVFINVFVFSYISFFVFYIASIVVTAVICIAFLAFKSSSDRQNEAFENAKISMLTMRSMVNAMINSEKGREYGALLNRLDENLRFSDDSTISGMDETIYNRIAELSHNISVPDYDVEGAINSINELIKQRNFMVKGRKAYN